MTDTPKRITLSRARGWRMPEGAVKVDRTTRFGNPFQVWQDEYEKTWWVSRGGNHHPARSKAEAQALAVSLFRELVTDPAAASRFGAYPHPTDIVKALRGRDLACWCKPGSPCHADVLIEIANRPLCEAVR